MPAPPPFDVTNWYWIVAGSTTQVYSSASGGYVPVSDPTYVAWLATGKPPRPIVSEAALGAYLAGYLQRPVAAGVLDAYQDTQAGAIVTQTIFKILFNHENRTRAIERALSLNGSPPNLTPAQAKAAVKALM